MDRPDDTGLGRLAQRIADGGSVDWEQECLEGTVTMRQVRHLRLVERISDAHRRLLLDELPFESWGPLDLKNPAATGGFGEVYLARDRNLDRDVALKLFIEDEDSPPDEAYLEEARRLARVRHPNVVAIHGVDSHEGRMGLWMEWIDGETLKTIADERGPFAAEEAARVGIELCRALAAIHGEGLVHRDVKLANVMRETGGRIVLMDFGSSSHRDDGEMPRMGTPVYMPPEAFEGRDSGISADIYALGVLLYRLTGGDYPVEFDNAEAMRRAHREGRAVPLRDRNPNLPTEFVQVVERALDRDPAKRYASAGEMERALAATMGKHAPSPSPSPSPTPTPIWKQPVVWAVVSLVAVIMAAWGIQNSISSPYVPEAKFTLIDETREVELQTGMGVRVGQQLELQVSLDRPSWLYVVTADAKGEERVLFPVSAIPLANPLPSGFHTIPGSVDGERHAWDVETAGEVELLVVVASTEPVEDIEREVAGMKQVLPGDQAEVDDSGIIGRLRGITGMSPVPNGEGTPGSVSRIRDHVKIRTGKARGIRVWEYVLPNPEELDGSP